MSLTSDNGLLHSAFQRFERAAVHLERRHDQLRDRADQLERQLSGANRRLETVVDALDSGIAVVTPDGNVVRTNATFRRLFGNDPWITHPALVELLHGASGPSHLRISDQDQERDLAATLIPVDDEHDTRVITVTDITDVRREQEEGGRRRRLEAMGRLAAELAHEVRNPLGSIRLFASMLDEDLPLESEQHGMVQQIQAAVTNLEATVSNLLAFASPTSGERNEVDLVELAISTCALIEPACAVRDVKLIPPTTEPCRLAADAEGLRQVLLNLIGNALAATGSGGRIQIDVQRSHGRVVLSVEDNGTGIPAEDLPRVLDPFFTRTEGGTGLGLSIVHSIVERHDGGIRFDSQWGKGTRVSIEFPERSQT